MIQKAIALIEQYSMICEHDIVAAGVSGGADSLSLLFVLLEYRKKVPFELVVVHVNHMIREDADRDSEFVRNICSKENIPFYLKEVDVANLAKAQNLSEEEVGRNVRYEAFREALDWYQKQEGCFFEEKEDGYPEKKKRNQEERKVKIAVAHHQGDSAETLLFHLFRGTGIYGMAGILPVNGNIIRPLLTCSRKEIEEYLVERKQKWCIDSTNEEDTYTRNRIRHHILGYADREINDRATEHVAKAALQMTALREYLEYEVKRMEEQIAEYGKGFVRVDISKLKTYPELLQSQFLLSVIGNILPGRRDIGSEHIQGILNLLDKTGSKKMNLPKNVEVVKEYQNLWIKIQNNSAYVEKKPAKEECCQWNGNEVENKMLGEEGECQLKIGENYLLQDGSILEISLITPEELSRIEEKKYTKYFDYDKINNYLKLRFRQAGDYMVINDLGQKKTLKEYFINEKVPASVRAKIPVIADGSHILWAVGYRISAYYKVTSKTQKIVQMTIRRDKNVREN